MKVARLRSKVFEHRYMELNIYRTEMTNNGSWIELLAVAKIKGLKTSCMTSYIIFFLFNFLFQP